MEQRQDKQHPDPHKQHPDPQRRNQNDRKFGQGGQDSQDSQDRQGQDRPFGQPDPKKPGAHPDEDDAS